MTVFILMEDGVALWLLYNSLFVILSPGLLASPFFHRVLQGLTLQLRKIIEERSYLARIVE